MRKSNEWDNEDMPARQKGMMRVMLMGTLPDGRRYKDHAPSPAAMLEAKRANELAAREPLRFAFGDPLPGRSALDKMKKESRA